MRIESANGIPRDAPEFEQRSRAATGRGEGDYLSGVDARQVHLASRRDQERNVGPSKGLILI
jgi:hypothetical protein